MCSTPAPAPLKGSPQPPPPKSSPPPSPPPPPSTQPYSTTHKILLLHIALLIAAFGVLTPFYQSRRDALDCDARCYGYFSSTRSAVGLIGSLVITRASDQIGRKPLLFIGLGGTLLGLYFSATTTTLSDLYLSMIPGALLQQNFSISKAYIADLASLHNLDDATKTSLVGKLGMVVGLAFMLGPALGGSIISTIDVAVKVAACLVVLSAVSLTFLPNPPRSNPTPTAPKPSFFNIPTARTPGALCIMAMRILMSLAFHMFITVWTPSLKSRFDFGPKDHGQFMSAVGLFYAVSQGFAAPRIVAYAASKTRVLACCCVALSVGRCAALATDSLSVVYALFFCIITALGTFNTVLTNEITGLAAKDEVGGLIGVLGSVESVAGMVGPVVGGELYRIWEFGPIVFVCVAYLGVAGIVLGFYDKAMLMSHSKTKKDKAL